MVDRMDIVVIKSIENENPLTKTISFIHSSNSIPGQFVMVWIPGVDEIPMSLSYIGKIKGFAVHRKGDATEALHKLRVGESIGIRGPYGNGFNVNRIKGKKILCIGGGTGIAPLSALSEEMAKRGKRVTVVIGAKTSEELLYVSRLKRVAKVIIATEDGSCGVNGTAVDAGGEIMNEYDEVFTCGPELMMKKILDIALNFGKPLHASIERYMKCGIGICDSCAINGYHVCRDGPVFSSLQLKNMRDFGVCMRDGCGKRVSI